MTFENIPTKEQICDKLWRLENLYLITDKDGNEINFKLNWAQKELYENFWYQMLVLKARQLGITTFFSISFLDDCFWIPNMSAGIIADRKESSEDIFKKKVKFAYEHMPEWTRIYNSATNDRAGELAFRNGSSFRVSTGFRSGTNQRLLVSEFGKICSKAPDVAKEIVTGSLNTVSRDQIVVIESTAEGREGYFYDFSKEAERLSIEKKKLSPMQQRFFFFPWWKESTYSESGQNGEIEVTNETKKYIQEIEKECKTTISDAQMRWYELKNRSLGDSMKQEYPSTPKEAFESSNEGLYYGAQIAKLRLDGKLCDVPYQDCSLVHTSWDIGYDDQTSIFFFQLAIGGLIQIIDYFENVNEGAKYYADYLRSKPYAYGTHLLPHDARNKNPATGTSWYDVFSNLVDGTCHVLEKAPILNGIQNVRSILGRCVFDNNKCHKGIRHLESYKKDWDPKIGGYKNHPCHDQSSHAADSFRYLAQGLNLVGGTKLSPDKINEMRLKHLGY